MNRSTSTSPAGRYNGTWHIEGASLLVSSAYGSGKARIGRARPETVAAKVLTAILDQQKKIQP